MTPLKIYLAARYSRREELCEKRTDLEYLRFEVTSRWLDESSGSMENLNYTRRREVGEIDANDLIRSDAMIVFTPGGRHGGLWVEFGGAFFTDRKLFICGPLEGAPVFAYSPKVVKCVNWDETLSAVMDWRNEHRFYHSLARD